MEEEKVLEQKSAKRKRTESRKRYNRALNDVETLINESVGSEKVVSDTFETLKEAQCELLKTHDQYSITLCSDDEGDGNIDDYLDAPEKAFKLVRNQVQVFLEQASQRKA